MLQQLRYLAEYVPFRAIVGIIEWTPPRIAARVAECLAVVIFRCLSRKVTRYEVARQNLRRAFGDQYNDAEIDRIIVGMWRHLFRMIAEIVQMPSQLRLENCKRVVQYRQGEQAVRALCSDRPVILVSGHFGNWEMAVSCFGIFGFPMAVIARDLDNPYLHNWFRRFREHTGHTLISKKGAFNRISEILEGGGTVALLGDQDAGTRGTFVDFFGQPASTHGAIALLALRYDALICVGYAYRLQDRFNDGFPLHYEVGCEEVVDPRETVTDDEVAEVTARYTAALERVIRRAPEQYFWVHRRWKTRPDQAERSHKRPLKKAG